ncbi:hypothetical protein [Saccharothrix luteola]|nr:hypothetical protein [Saccharothrix luteola]
MRPSSARDSGPWINTSSRTSRVTSGSSGQEEVVRRAPSEITART